ncbi:MAG TPA: hypothetical protein VK791_08065 [bacterium]|nr:hypothetical protein [bacterium]
MKKVLPQTAEPALDVVWLPKPDQSGGNSVLESLRKRKTDRKIGTRKIYPQLLSNLL